MKKDRIELEQYLLKECEYVALDSNKCLEIAGYMNKKYGISTGSAMDMIVRGKFGEQTEHGLFCLLDGLIAFKRSACKLEEYYTQIEINNYSSSKITKSKIKFPIRIKCLQVAEDQWIGKTDTEFFMSLRAAQLINYNENAQRTLTKINTKNGEYYKITLNESALKSIRSSYQEKCYIPTPITLNIPEDSDADFYYDEDECTLVINSLPCFDISDGYHRYIAMCRERDTNPDFNLPWELRIINFSDSKARQFIFQEDQKTKMKKADSKTMNQRSPVNRAVNRLNEDSLFCLFGEINGSGGKLPKTEFTVALEDIFFENITKKDNENLVIKNIVQDIKNKFNYLSEVNEEYLIKKYTYKDIVVLLYAFYHTKELEQLDRIITYMNDNIETIDERKFAISKGINKSLKNDLQRLYEEVL